MKSKLPFVSHQGPIAIAHRGGNAAGKGKENTLAAFKAAYDLGYRYFETDVLTCASGELILYHGIRSDRKARRAGWTPRRVLQNMSLSEIRNILSINGEEIPTLEELLDAFPDAFINIDPKTREAVVPLGDLLKRRNDYWRVCIGSVMYARTLMVARMLGGQDKICTVLTSHSTLLSRGVLRLNAKPLVRRLSQSRAACLELPHYLISKKLIEAAHEAGLKIYAWTVNTQPKMEKLLDWGIDGIMTDEVRLLKQVMNQRGL